MYFKVASVLLLSLFLSGCSMFSDPKPKKPDVKVVEEIENNVTADSNASVAVESSKPARTVEEKYKLKPEPFSLKSNEDDPELLGPQTTIDRGLNRVDEPTPVKEESKKTSKKAVDRKVEEAKDKLEKAKEEKLPSADNKKEAL